jgi:subtilase family serine protease
MNPKKLFAIQFTALLILLSIPALQASAQSTNVQQRITGPVGSGQMVPLLGHVSRKADPQYDQGRVEPSFQLNDVTLLTLPSASQQKALSLLVAEQQDRSSPNYHKWLTPEEYADRFGLSANDVAKISTWLKSQGLSVVSVARGRNWIVFSGTASQIESAFRTEIHSYNVKGDMHFANATPPSIPAALSGVVTGIRGLDDFRPKPSSIKKSPQAQNVRGNYFDGSFQNPDFIAPGDIATIYNLSALYAGGFDGSGQKLVVVGQTDVMLSDLNDFRSGFGLTAITGCTANSDVITSCNTSNFRYVLDGTDPGVSPPNRGDLTEADLDLEWSAATARGAQIIYVNSTNVFTSYYFAIDQDFAPVISMSYGTCEFHDNNLANDEVELTKANSFGITFVNSSGDSGAAECDAPLDAGTSNLAKGGLAVAYPASSPEVTGVGGTATPFSDFTSAFWGTTNGANGGTALSYIPETAWNDDVELVNLFGGTPLSLQENSQIGIEIGGGGASNCSAQTPDLSSCVSGFPQPTWQTVTIPNQASVRFSPDVSLLASPNFPGYIYCTQVVELGDSGSGSTCAPGGTAGITSALALAQPSIVGGTSASAPVFAGIVTILNQFLGTSGLGNINPTLYQLAATPSNHVFHPVTNGNNMVNCEAGTPTNFPSSYQCPSSGIFGFDASNADVANGFNLVTGLGSVDADNLANGFSSLSTAPNFNLSFSPTAITISSPGQSGSATLTVTATHGFTGTVTFSCTNLSNDFGCSFSQPSVTGSGTTMLTITTMAPSSLAPMRRPTGLDASPKAFELSFIAIGILWIAVQVKRRRWSAVATAFAFCCLLGVTACGSGGSSTHTTGGTQPVNGQSVIVNVTDGTTTHNTNLLVTVN